MNGLIYIAINKVNSKVYIGKTTKSLKQRIRSHKSASDSKFRNNKFVQALRKYGVEGFDWKILLDNVPEKDLDWHETSFILTFDSKAKGYNCTVGGLVEKNIDFKPFGVTPWNKGTKGVMKPNSTSIKTGQHLSRLTEIKSRQRLSPKTEFKSGQKAFNAKRVAQYDLNGNLLNIFKNCTEAARNVGVSDMMISRVLRKKHYRCKDFFWQEIKDGVKVKNKIEIPTTESKSGRPVAIGQFSLDGKLIKCYKSVRQAAREIGTSKSNLYDCLYTKKNTFGGFLWKRV